MSDLDAFILLPTVTDIIFNGTNAIMVHNKDGTLTEKDSTIQNNH
jgi:type IV secretory pathway ATPase VirB11/archaellum biosynthesis ATPase